MTDKEDERYYIRMSSAQLKQITDSQRLNALVLFVLAVGLLFVGFALLAGIWYLDENDVLSKFVHVMETMIGG